MGFSTFEKKIGVIFHDKGLLKQAFTHRSYINENKDTTLEHNERLEFLGDAVLELVVTEHLFEKYPKSNEGEMTSYRSAMVNATTLSGVASALGINEHLLLSHGEAKDTGRARSYILADTFEAVIGAIFMDQGYVVVKNFIAKNLFPLIDDIIKNKLWLDAKSLFQEKAQEEVGVTPSYDTLKQEGPDHNKNFTIGVYLKDKLIAKGEGRSKQEAEQDAAQNALKAKKWS